MDTNLVNNQIILMRKMVRIVRRLVKQKLNKQIKGLKIKLNKNIEKTTKKTENKINNKKKELIAINGINVDEVSKQALIQNKDYFEKIIKSGQSSFESKAMARIAINSNVVRVVNKFKAENPNCDQWLPSQIELWQHKRLIKKNKIQKNKALIGDKNDETIDKTNIKTNVKTNELNSESKQIEIKSNSDSNIKRKSENKSKSVSNIPKIVKKEKKMIETEEKKSETVVDNKKPKSDPFFLSKDGINESDDESDDKKQNISTKHQKTERFGSKFDNKQKNSKSFEKSRNSIQNQRKSNLKPKKFDSKPFPKDNSKPKSKSESSEELHPSWAAKRSAKEKVKIDFSGKPLAKKIKFNN